MGSADVFASDILQLAGGLQTGSDNNASKGRLPVNPLLESMVQFALGDAARRSRRDISALTVALAEAVVWPDGSMGCPQPGMAYTQALVPGFRIQILADGQTLEYHASTRGQPFYCPPTRITLPTPEART